MGNFWVDLVRITYYLLLPICLVFAIFLISQGMIQNFKPYDAAALTEKETVQVPKTDASGNPVKDAQGNPVMVPQVVDTQTIPQGPMASQVAIKMLGTNGGGYTNANAAHPFENPTPFSNFIQMLSIFAIPSALTYYLGRMVKSPGHGWSVWAAMALLFLAGFLVCWHYEAAGNPILTQLGVDPADGNMEGKEVRFGIINSALFATITTDASCGAVNSMHDSFTPLGGLVPLFNIELGEVVFGGVGAGLYGMLVFVIVAVFIAGLMVGRTPEYLGKKIQSFEVKMSMLVLLVLAMDILGFTAWACVSDWGKAGLNNQRAAWLQRNALRLQLGDRQQRQRLRRPDRKHLLVRHHAGHRHVHRPLPDDRADHGHRRFARGEEARSCRAGLVSGLGRDLHVPPHRHRSAGRRA